MVVPGQCQVPNNPGSCSWRPVGEEISTVRGEERDKESNREIFKPWAPRGRGVKSCRSYLQKRIGRERAGRAGGQEHLPALCPMHPKLAVQPGGQKSIATSTQTCAIWPNRAVGPQSFVSRVLLQGNHTVLLPRNIKLPSALNFSVSAFWEHY